MAAPSIHPLDRGRARRLMLMLMPALVLLGIFFVVPLLGIAGRSVFTDRPTLANYVEIFGDPVYFIVIALTFRMALIVTLVCVVVGYPTAYVLAHLPDRAMRVLMIAVVLPYFTSVIVRTYAWIVLLGREGLVNQYLGFLGFGRVDLLYNQTGVLIGMGYVLLPLMILTLLTGMRSIDQSLVRAAYGLGAGRWYAFRRIYLPLSLPALTGGMLLVFILGIGFYITPALMGGPADLTIAMLIQREVEITVNWSFAAALAMVLLAVTLLAFAVYGRLVRLERLLKSAP